MKCAPGRHLGCDHLEYSAELGTLALGRGDLEPLQERGTRAYQGRELVEECQDVFQLGLFVRPFGDSSMRDHPFLEWQDAPPQVLQIQERRAGVIAQRPRSLWVPLEP